MNYLMPESFYSLMPNLIIHSLLVEALRGQSILNF